MNIRILCAVFEGLEGGFGCDGESSWCDFAHFSDLGLNPLPARPLVVLNGSSTLSPPPERSQVASRLALLADAAVRDGGERLGCLGSAVLTDSPPKNRSASEDPAGKGHSDSVVPPAGC